MNGTKLGVASVEEGEVEEEVVEAGGGDGSFVGGQMEMVGIQLGARDGDGIGWNDAM